MDSELMAISKSDVFERARMSGAKLTDDTRDVERGDIFVLRRGATEFSQDTALRLCSMAEERGACAIISDGCYSLPLDIPVLRLTRPHERLNDLAEAFWGRPSDEMKIIAVTGTNGKTTTTYLLESIAREMGLRVGVLGTISHRFPGYEEPSLNTTPGTLKLRRLMRMMADAHCDIVAMEVSSHGIMQGRVDGVSFDAAIWNNLGTDHLDYHHTREAYGLAKRRLFDTYLVRSFSEGKHPVAVVNGDDVEVMAHIRAAHPSVWGGAMTVFSSTGHQAQVVIAGHHWCGDRWKFDVCIEGRHYDGELPLVGEYNLTNATGALAALVSLGYSPQRVVEALSHVSQIPGRMECVHHNPLVLVDFAHTPEALKNALLAVRQSLPGGGRVIVVFGAGGDRDPSKRPMMGAFASEFADEVIVTSDNPRTEDPQAIVNQIVKGMGRAPLYVTLDRREAIARALQYAEAEDIVLIAGKGHEDYQIVGTEKQPFDDREAVREFYAHA